MDHLHRNGGDFAVKENNKRKIKMAAKKKEEKQTSTVSASRGASRPMNLAKHGVKGKQKK